MNTRTKTALERMAAQRFPSDELLRDTQPDGPHARLLGEPLIIPSAVADLSPSRTRIRTRRRVLVAAALATVAAAGSVTVIPRLAGPAADAATAPLLQYTPLPEKETATDMLTDLAARARSQPPLPGSGPYHYIHTRGWYLHSAQTTDGRILDSRIEASDREKWIASDGSGRLEEVRGGQRTRWSGTFGPGGLTPAAEVLQHSRTRTTADWFQAIRETWSLQAVPPEQQSELLNTLAAQPNLVLEGTVNDRAGRQGIAISTVTQGETPEMRYVLVLDPETGMLLDFEEVALTSDGLPIEAPATIGYTLWLASGYTATTTERP